MRLVTDSNILVSGLLWGGVPGRLIDAAQEATIELITSRALLAELRHVLFRDKFAGQLERRGLTAGAVYEGYAALATLVHRAQVEAVIVRDPADDEVLAAARAGNADLIVSGDADVLGLGAYRGIPILRASAAINFIDAALR